jgi:hypothetical protein
MKGIVYKKCAVYAEEGIYQLVPNAQFTAFFAIY